MMLIDAMGLLVICTAVEREDHLFLLCLKPDDHRSQLKMTFTTNNFYYPSKGLSPTVFHYRGIKILLALVDTYSRIQVLARGYHKSAIRHFCVTLGGIRPVHRHVPTPPRYHGKLCQEGREAY